jgi:hypothetical protein
MSRAARYFLMDASSPGRERERDVRQVLELVRLHHAQRAVVALLGAQPQDREEPRVGLAAAGDALLEKLDELVRELVEVHQDGLLHLQGLELLLGNLHAVEKERIRIARHLDAKHLRGVRRDAGVKTRGGVKRQRSRGSCNVARFREWRRDAFREPTRGRRTDLVLLRLVEPQQDSNGELFDFLGRAVGAALDAHGNILVEEVRGVLDVRRLPRRGVALDDVGRRWLVRHRARPSMRRGARDA